MTTEEIQKVVFTIDEHEIQELTWRKLSKEELTEVLSFIENDECLWNAIEDSKREALKCVSR